MSWRSSNVDEMVLSAFVKKRPPLPKEEVHWRVLSVIGFAIIRGGLLLVGNAPRPSAVVGVVADHDGVVLGCPDKGVVVRVAADHDGVVPGCPGGGAVVRVAADDDGVVLGRPGGGAVVANDSAFEDPAKRWDIADGERGAAAIVDKLVRVLARMLLMESLVRRP